MAVQGWGRAARFIKQSFSRSGEEDLTSGIPRIAVEQEVVTADC